MIKVDILIRIWQWLWWDWYLWYLYWSCKINWDPVQVLITILHNFQNMSSVKCLGIFTGTWAFEYLLIVWSLNPIGAEMLKFCTHPGQLQFKEKNLKSLSWYTNVGLKWGGFMVFNTTFNNTCISVISWQGRTKELSCPKQVTVYMQIIYLSEAV